ncbi:MAG: hypothetical protein R3B60_02200 [Candidatus Paceibacterota bacterium]
MKPIKKIAGEMLLYFYWLQRSDSTKLHDAMLSFQLRHFPTDRKQTGPLLERRDTSILNVDELSSYTDVDLYNALGYLSDCYLITLGQSKDNFGVHFLNIKLTASGFDIIEGVERGDEERTQFNVTFNFNLKNEITVESLLRAEFGSLIKASII